LFRHLRPRRVIEVGSGLSSALMLDIADRSSEEIDFVFIEPFAGRLKSLLRSEDLERRELIEKRVQDVPVERFETLRGNDVLFIDSSHVTKIGSDVNYLLFEVIPRLQPGVVVHFHDVFWPFEYPLRWIENGHAWNEAYLLRAFLQYNKTFAVLLFNNLIGTVCADFLAARMPLVLTDRGGSLWLQNAAHVLLPT
jgi:predicted O-methyltransferase YrrM